MSDFLGVFEATLKAGKSYACAVRQAYRDTLTGDPQSDYYTTRLGRAEEEQEVQEPATFAGCLTGETGNPTDCTCPPDRFPFSQGRSCGVKQANSWAACTRPAGHEGAHMNGGISFTVPEATSAAGADSPVPAAEGTTPGEYAAVAVREVLAEHMPVGDTLNGLGNCECAPGDSHIDDYEWREHVAAEVSRRIDAALEVPERFRPWFQQ